MQYYGIIKNDVCAGEGVCVTFFTQGCPHRCPGCHNEDSWDFLGGREFTTDVLNEILEAISANGVLRNFCVMGGEPLCSENAFLTQLVIENVLKMYPTIKIYIWTGYTWEELMTRRDPKVMAILKHTDVLIDGRYIEEERDITLPMRGSRNQRIIDVKKELEQNESV